MRAPLGHKGCPLTTSCRGLGASDVYFEAHVDFAGRTPPPTSQFCIAGSCGTIRMLSVGTRKRCFVAEPVA
jgi:hypothetical protein